MTKRYTIGRVAIDINGQYWFSVVCDCTPQGGPNPGWYHFGSSLEGGLAILEGKIREYEHKYIEGIKEKEKEND
jgi:hypothetical protein